MKVCSKCKQKKIFDEFSKNRTAKDGLQSYCKVCSLAATKLDYRKNNRKSLFIERSKKILQELREICNYIKSYNGCAFCNEKEPCCMDFHHLDKSQKDTDVSYLRRAKSKKRMFSEMKKSVVVCSNCHRKIHNNILKPTKKQLCKIPENIKNAYSI
jgi:hypothetical protein